MSDPVSSQFHRLPDSAASQPLELEPVVIAGDAGASSTPTQVIDLEPVVIVGEAGVKELVRRHQQSAPSDSSTCREDAFDAFAECNGALWAGLGAGVAMINPVAFAIGLGAASSEGLKCGRAIAQLTDCSERAAAREAGLVECEERGGVALQGAAENELICLVRP